jgi:hypothetical protein
MRGRHCQLVRRLEDENGELHIVGCAGRKDLLPPGIELMDLAAARTLLHKMLLQRARRKSGEPLQ